jgi:hypothetical protein
MGTVSRFDQVTRNPDFVERRKSKPSGLQFDRDVGCAVVLAWTLFAALASGGALAAVAYWTMEPKQAVIWSAVGIVIVVASTMAIIVFWYTMDRYHYRPEDVEVYEREIEVEEPARYHVKTAPNTYRIGKYKFTELQWKQLAERCWHNGQWAGGHRMTRKLWAGIVKNETENYKLIYADFMSWGFIDSEYNWLEDGRLAIRDHLPTPT